MSRFAPQEIRTFFISTNAIDRRSIFQTDRMALLLLDVLRDNREKKRFLLHEYVVMRDHIHLIITPAHEHSLEKCVQFIKGGFSFRSKRELGFEREIWQPGFKDHRIDDARDYETHVVYVHQNPVKRGLVGKAEDYEYSSANPKIEIDRAPQQFQR
jgi:REP-associated tyrosine transposase